MADSAARYIQASIQRINQIPIDSLTQADIDRAIELLEYRQMQIITESDCKIEMYESFKEQYKKITNLEHFWRKQ